MLALAATERSRYEKSGLVYRGFIFSVATMILFLATQEYNKSTGRLLRTHLPRWPILHQQGCWRTVRDALYYRMRAPEPCLHTFVETCPYRRDGELGVFDEHTLRIRDGAVWATSHALAPPRSGQKTIHLLLYITSYDCCTCSIPYFDSFMTREQ